MTHYHHVPHYPPQKTGPGPVKIALSVIAVLGFAAVGSCAVCSVVVGSAATEVAEERKAEQKAADDKLRECHELARAKKVDQVSWAAVKIALQQNEASIAANWKNTCIRVSGTVHTIMSGIRDEPTVVISTGERFESHKLYCKPADPSEAMKLRKGQNLVVYGIGGGEMMGSLSLDGCAW
jgi:hypothetical protein